MKNIKTLKHTLLVASIIFCASCNKNRIAESNFIQNGQLNPKSSEIAKDFSVNNKLIVVSPEKFTNANFQSLNSEDQGQMRAAVYRFYKHISIVNGRMETDLKSGSEINVSEEVFKVLYNNLKDMNRQIDSLDKIGIKMEVPDVNTPKYLNGLLK